MSSLLKKVTEKIAENPNLIKPHVMVEDITTLNFHKMKKMGFNKIMIKECNVVVDPETS